MTKITKRRVDRCVSGDGVRMCRSQSPEAGYVFFGKRESCAGTDATGGSVRYSEVAHLKKIMKLIYQISFSGGINGLG